MMKKLNTLIYSFLVIIVGCDELSESDSVELLCDGESYTTKDIMTNISEEIYNDDES